MPQVRAFYRNPPRRSAEYIDFHGHLRCEVAMSEWAGEFPTIARIEAVSEQLREKNPARAILASREAA